MGWVGSSTMIGGLLRRLAVRGAGRAENLAELGPLRRRDAGAVIADHAAALGHERDERGAHLRRVEDVADGVVQIHRVVLLQVGRGDGARFAGQRRREGPGLLTHQLHREIGVRNRGVAAVMLAVVNPLPIEDEEFPRLLGSARAPSRAGPPRSSRGPRARLRGAGVVPAPGRPRPVRLACRLGRRSGSPAFVAWPASASLARTSSRAGSPQRPLRAPVRRFSYRVAPGRANGA